MLVEGGAEAGVDGRTDGHVFTVLNRFSRSRSFSKTLSVPVLCLATSRSLVGEPLIRATLCVTPLVRTKAPVHVLVSV